MILDTLRWQPAAGGAWESQAPSLLRLRFQVSPAANGCWQLHTYSHDGNLVQENPYPTLKQAKTAAQHLVVQHTLAHVLA